jgi:phospholipid/cholesterol/gamma-HCH transport system ATP-binding protein
MVIFRNVKKSFGSLQVLRGVNLEIEENHTTAIIGGSGCGKSVLLKHIIGLLTPEEGEVIINGLDVTRLDVRGLNEVRKKISMVFQNSALFDSLNVADNLALGLRRHTRLKEQEIQQKIRKVLALVGLESSQEQYPAELSGGMRKRAAIARAVITDPELILYDEPTTGLDPPRADRINQLIIDLNKHLSVTSIVVTHDMHSVYRVAKMVAMLDGVIRFHGTPAELARSSEPAVMKFLESARGHEWLNATPELEGEEYYAALEQ